MQKSVKYSTLDSSDATCTVYYDGLERKERLGYPSFGVCDYLVLFFIYIVWIASLPVSWWCSFKVISQYEGAIISRLGRVLPLKGPGVICVIPLVDKWKKVDMRMKAFNVPPIEVVTMEKSILKVGADVRYRIVDPIAMHTLIKDVDHSLRVSGHTALSTQLSGQKLNFIQTEKSLLQLKLLNQMNKSVGDWGIEISKFELTQSTVLKDLSSLKADEDDETGVSAIVNIFKSMTSSSTTFGFPIPTRNATKQQSNKLLIPSEMFCIFKSVVNEQLCQQVNALYKFSISDSSGTSHWILDLKNSPGCVVTEPDPFYIVDVKFEMNNTVFQDIFYGIVSPTQAYMNGSLIISGSIQTAMKLECLIQQLNAKT